MFAVEPQKLPSYAFGSFILDSTQRLLLRDSEVVALPPKVLETLFILVENHGRILSKNELMDALWPDTFVEESSLSQNISLLRKALGKSECDPVFIETIPKRGYRFVAAVSETTPDTLDPDSTTCLTSDLNESPSTAEHLSAGFQEFTRVARWQSWPALLAVFCIVAASAGLFFWWGVRTTVQRGIGVKSVAVLPFKTVGALRDTELLQLGLTDSVILKLSRLDQITILPTSSIFKYLDVDQDALSMGRELGVDAVLDGTVQRANDRVRVTAHLITLRDGKTVWTGKFDLPYRDTFCLQDSLSDLLAEDVRLQVLNLQRKYESKPITRDAQAYEDYVKGLYLWNKRSSEPLSKAIAHLQLAVNRDSNFALAHALLADCYYVYSGTLKGDEQAARIAGQNAEAAARTAIQLDETLAEAHTALAGIMANRGDGEGASNEYRRALALNPGYATAHSRYSYFLLALLDLDGAVREARQAQQLDPRSPITNATLGYMLLMDRNYEESVFYSQTALELNGEAVAPRINLGLAQLHRKHHEDAITEFKRLAASDSVSSQINLALAYAKLGRQEESRKLIDEVMRSANRAHVNQFDLAVVYSAQGKSKKALEILRTATLSWLEKARLKLDPDLDELRSDPAFAAIVNEQFYPTQNLSARL
jgi:DNA-binding winged helix-turn-helix (wHTH) protein/TolB-like protein/Flp pilus assembly protein TadD